MADNVVVKVVLVVVVVVVVGVVGVVVEVEVEEVIWLVVNVAVVVADIKVKPINFSLSSYNWDEDAVESEKKIYFSFNNSIFKYNI